MPSSGQHVLTMEIARLREVIKRKYLRMRYGDVDAEQLLTKQYSPILNELSKIKDSTAASAAAAAAAVTPKVEVKSEDNKEKHEIMQKEEEEASATTTSTTAESTPNVSFMDTDVIVETPDSLESLLSTPQGRSESAQWIGRTFKNALTQRYLLKMIKDDKRSIDHTYGPRITEDGVMIGNKSVQFSDDGKIIIENVNYRGTSGLYELMFKRQPKDGTYTEDDLQAYKDICIQASVHKRRYDPHGQVNRNPKSLKYKKVIQYLFPPRTFTGRGIGGDGGGYSYWDNPNELCDRLRLLMLSHEAGHTGHTNEIASIIEELREAGFIKGSGNRKIRSLIR